MWMSWEVFNGYRVNNIDTFVGAYKWIWSLFEAICSGFNASISAWNIPVFKKHWNVVILIEKCSLECQRKKVI